MKTESEIKERIKILESEKERVSELINGTQMSHRDKMHQIANSNIDTNQKISELQWVLEIK